MSTTDQVTTEQTSTEQVTTEQTSTGADEAAAAGAAETPEATNAGAYDGQFRPDANRQEQSAEDEALVVELEEAMRDVVDPELGINVVDLGLVYDIWVRDHTIARVDMTLTSAACPLTDVIEDQARAAVVGSGLCTDLELQWVWMPPWGPHMITDDGREQLRALGFTL